MEMAIVAIFVIAVIALGEFGPKVRDYRRNQIMTTTKNRGPQKQQWRKLKVDIGRKVNYSIPLDEEK